jgi:flagellar assembly factor FliW
MNASTLASAPDDTQTVHTRFGTFVGRTRDIVTLAEPLPGFEACRQFFVLSSPELTPLTCLQGLDDASPTFLAIDPRLVDPTYRCRLDDLQRRRVGATEASPLLWLAIVRVTESDGATANLRAPIVINPERMRAMQLLAGHDEYSTAHRLG